jgi:hypothetical protein
MDIVRSYPETNEGQSEIVGAIFDQDEARTFLEWLCSDEVRAIREQLRAQRSHTED